MPSTTSPCRRANTARSRGSPSGSARCVESGNFRAPTMSWSTAPLNLQTPSYKQDVIDHRDSLIRRLVGNKSTFELRIPQFFYHLDWRGGLKKKSVTNCVGAQRRNGVVQLLFRTRRS